MARGNFLRFLRTSLLLYILVMVALVTWAQRERTTSWDRTLWVSIYPINGDASEATAAHIQRLDAETFAPIVLYLSEQAASYGLTLAEPLHVQVTPQLDASPPTPPHGGNFFSVASWSLRMRFWSWQQERAQDLPTPDINIYVRYFDPAITERLEHSVGLQKGLLGVVNAFASKRYRGSNSVVIAHELLHTLGATDKYDLASGAPLHPSGFAEPDRTPLYPQTHAEIMGGRVPLGPGRAEVPASLNLTLVGPKTAQEIRWAK